jgi:hypothetical protein
MRKLLLSTALTFLLIIVFSQPIIKQDTASLLKKNKAKFQQGSILQQMKNTETLYLYF